jgi:hypothetical protein
MPRYTCSLLLPQLHFTYLQKQFHDSVKLMEFFTDFNHYLLHQRENLKYLQVRPLELTPRSRWSFALECVRKVILQRKNRSSSLFVMPMEIKGYYEEQFKMLHRKVKKGVDLTPEEQASYDRSIYIVPLHDLYEWTRQVLRVIKGEEERKTQQTQSKGFFGWFGGKTAPAPTEVKEDYQSLFKQLTQEADFSEVEAPPDYIWLRFDFELTSGLLALRKAKKAGQTWQEGMNFCISNVKSCFKAAKEAYSVEFSVDDCLFECLTESFPAPFLEKAAGQDRILDAAYRYKPAHSMYQSHLCFSSRSFSFTYTPQVANQLVSFFVVPNAQETFKAAAWDRWQEIQDSTQGTLADLVHSEVKVLVELSIAAPLLVLPMPEGMFALSLGNLKMSNGGAAEGLHEVYSTQVTSVALFYQSPEGRIDIVPEFSIQLVCGFLKAKIRKKKAKLRVTSYDGVPDVTVSCTLPELRCHLAPSVYSKLLNIKEHLRLNSEAWPQTSREEVLSTAVLVANVQRQGQSVKSWSENEAIVSKSYIYFFQDDVTEAYFWLKDCAVQDASAELQVSNAIKISNRYGECVLAFASRAEAYLWMRTIGDLVSDLTTSTSAAVDNDSLRNLIRGTKMLLKAELVVQQVVVRLCNEQLQEWFEYQSTDVTSEVTARPYDLVVKASMHTITIVDLLKATTHPFRLIANTERSSSLIDVLYVSARPGSHSFEGQDVRVTVQLRKLELNWNPDLFTSLLNFLDFAKARHSQSEVSKATTVGRLQPHHVLLNLSITVGSVVLHLNVLENIVRLATVLVEGLETQILVRNSGYYMSGDLQNLTINDTTQYPELALLRPLSSIEPFTLFSVQ